LALALAACTSSTSLPPTSSTSITGTSTTTPATTTTTQAVVTAKAPLCTGRSIAPASLSAITFFSATTGLGLWSRNTGCGARLVRSRDGGRTWRVVGDKLPAAIVDFSPEAIPTMVFPTASVGWVRGGGVLVTTRNGGSTWTPVPLGGWVAAISRSGSSLWAFVAPCNPAPGTCRYRLEATTLNGPSWRTVASLPAAMGNYGIVVARLTALDAVIDNGQDGPVPAFVTSDGGAHWSAVNACGSVDFSAVTPAATGPVAATSSRDVLEMCVAGAGMGSAVKALFRSSDGGKTWQAVAIDRGLDLPPAQNPIPTEAGEVLGPKTSARRQPCSSGSRNGSLGNIRLVFFDAAAGLSSFNAAWPRAGTP